uniref:isoleucine--tRNA ligase n=1 Tax=Ndongobacter massiliensis TaxID=1871025 RepID=UPI000930773E|nr:isoleucine--tRNA ligase [Ndongobacter massiliensis]
MKFYDFSKESAQQMEARLAQKWEEEDLLRQSVEAREGCPSYVFFDGPPTANGNPGIHHVISRTLKDMTCRYKTMRGYQVKRKAGWDTHGLPVEIEVEKELHLNDKKGIEAYGIKAFNKRCRDSVFRYRDQWTEMSKRMAFLADMEHPYVTLENDYIETEWHLLKDFFEKGLLYKGAKILPYCPRCGTGLASHEVAQGYQEDDVVTVVVKFPVKGRDNEFFLAWTTTPWTLPSNVALTVHPDVEYVRVRQNDEIYYVADALKDAVLKEEFGPYEILERMKGRDLEYMEYEQLLPFISVPGKAFFVTCAEYVTTEDGTGIVHTAPAFGEDDYNTGRRYDLPLVSPVGDDGKFTEGPYAGRFVMDADPDIIVYLREQGKLYSRQKLTHNYPHCWRCHTPLIYYSKPSWYIEVTKYKEQLVANNNGVNWFPPFVGEKRFGNWLENLNDWAISRSRYWGTPLNLWVCEECGHVHAIGSREELVERAIEPIDASIDLHRPYVDDVHLRCSCGGRMTRESDVIDVWFDSGAMPFAQWHYPFEHREDFEQRFPADFICEGIDQTRGWFYSLMAISTLYKGISPYKNVLVNDLVLDKDGKKMSKSVGNTLNPFEMFDRFSADAVRFYSLYVSPPWVPTRFDVAGLKEVNAKFFRTVKNVYALFALYANTNELDPRELDIPFEERPEIDRWLLSRYASLRDFYDREMERFEYTKVVRALSDFVVEDVSNWYIRRNRRRFWSSENNADTLSVFRTTWEVLVGLAKIIAPITPFLAEELYLNLLGDQAMASVHIETFEEVPGEWHNETLENKMDLVRKIVNLGRASREEARIKVRQPLSEILVDAQYEALIGDLSGLIQEELNVKQVVFSSKIDEFLEITLKPDYRVAGPVLGAAMRDFAKALAQVEPHAFLRELSAGTAQLEVGGEMRTVPKEYVLATYRAKEGFDVAMDEGVSVVLDTTLDEDLIAEGFMREFVSKVQQQRRTSGYEVTDRIAICYAAEDVVAQALELWKDTIASETLALSIRQVPESDAVLGSAEAVGLNGHPVRFVTEKMQ